MRHSNVVSGLPAIAVLAAAFLGASAAAAEDLTLSLNPLTAGCQNSTATITIDAPAPPGGTEFTLDSNVAEAVVPATATVAEGATTANFTVTTSAVAAAVVATITAQRAGGPLLSRSLTLNPMTPATLSMSPQRIGPGQTSTGTVGLDCAAGPSDISVTITSNSGDAVVQASPITISAGSQTGTFDVVAGTVTGNVTATITATANGGSRNTSLTIEPVNIDQISFSPSSPVGGQASTGTVTLEYPATAGGVTVDLSSDNPGVASPDVPSINIAEGQTTGTFGVTTTPQLTDVVVTFTGTLNGTKTRTMTVRKNRIQSYSVSVSTISPCRAVTATVTLAQAAGATPIVLQVDNDRTDIATASVTELTYSNGESSKQFTISAVTPRTGTNQTANVSVSFERSPTDTQTLNVAFDVPRISTVACP